MMYTNIKTESIVWEHFYGRISFAFLSFKLFFYN